MNGGVTAEVVDGKVVRLEASAPVGAKVLRGPRGPELLLVGAAAGLLEGDCVHVRLRLAPGATLTVRTVAATLAHACPAGGSTRFDVDAVLGRGARLAWLPEPLVAHAGCRHHGHARIRLDEDGVVVWSEVLTLGRYGEDAGEVALRLDADLAGRPLLRDGLRVAGPPHPVVLDGARHVGTVALLGAVPPTDIDDAMSLAGLGAVLRGLAGDAASLDRFLDPARRAFLARLDLEDQPRVA